MYPLVSIHQLMRESLHISHQKLLLLIGGRVTGHPVEINQIPQHTVPQHRQVGGDGRQSVTHENTRGVAGQVELAEQEFHCRLAEMGSTFQQLNQ